jgi:hypothetical protein
MRRASARVGREKDVLVVRRKKAVREAERAKHPARACR